MLLIKIAKFVTAQARQRVRIRCESTQRHMGVRGDSEPRNSINTYRPCTKGYRKTTKLAKGSGATKYLGIGVEQGVR